jgi:hypothetical protein
MGLGLLLGGIVLGVVALGVRSHAAYRSLTFLKANVSSTRPEVAYISFFADINLLLSTPGGAVDDLPLGYKHAL